MSIGWQAAAHVHLRFVNVERSGAFIVPRWIHAADVGHADCERALRNSHVRNNCRREF